MNIFGIEPIKLLSGSHKDTARTGQGCFMNVIAYLNGEPQITDHSPCVCPTIRSVAIWLNDYMDDGERRLMIPFIPRAMGSATNDPAIMQHRLKELVSLARDMATLAQRYAANAAPYAPYASYANAAANAANAANAYAATYAAYANASYANAAAVNTTNAASYAAAAAKAANAAYADAAYAKARKEIIERVLAFMDAVCPAADEPTQEIIERAQKLCELART